MGGKQSLCPCALALGCSSMRAGLSSFLYWSLPQPKPQQLLPPCLLVSRIAMVRWAQNLPWLPSGLRIKFSHLIRALYHLTLAHQYSRTSQHSSTVCSQSLQIQLLSNTCFHPKAFASAGSLCLRVLLLVLTLTSAHPSGLTLQALGPCKKSSPTSHSLLGLPLSLP